MRFNIKSLVYSSCLLSGFYVNMAHAEFMTEADRRAQLVELAERSHNQSLLVSSDYASKDTKSHTANRANGSVHTAFFEGNSYPQYQPGTIVINTGGRVLHFIEDETTMRTYPIAVGREGAQWIGTTKVTHKRKNPEWRPTPNMRKRNPKLPEVVRAGPSNPLGARAIYLAEGYLRIHGTNDPKSIGKAASSGCYRMHNEDVSELFELVHSGAKVVVLN